jgi:hypothetical protein
MDSGFLIDLISMALVAPVVELLHTAVRKPREQPRESLGKGRGFKAVGRTGTEPADCSLDLQLIGQ